MTAVPGTVPRTDTVFAALVAGLDQAPMTDGDGTRLTCSDRWVDIKTIADGMLPFLLLQLGPAAYSEWESPFVTQAELTILGQLKVKGRPGMAPGALRRALDDVLSRMARLRGLHVHRETGRLVLFSKEAIKLSQQDMLMPLAFRGGPILRSATPRPQSDAGYEVADLQIVVAFINDFDPTKYPDPAGDFIGSPPMVVGSVGGIIRPPGGPPFLPTSDPAAPFELQLPVMAPEQDTERQTFYAGPDISAEGRDPQVFPGYSLAGVQATNQDPIKEVVVMPATRTLAALATAQLQAISIRVSGITAYITGQATWSTSDALVATVDAAGLVTAVATGTCTLTCSMGGASGTCALTVP